MVGDQALELADQLRVAAQLEIGFEAILDRDQPQLFETSYRWHGPQLVTELGQRRPAPERQRLLEIVPAAARGELLEAAEVELARLDPDEVAAGAGNDPVASENPPESGHPDLEGVPGGVRRFVTPELVD